MFASLRKYRGVRNPREAARRVEGGLVPLFRGLEGFRGCYLIDGGDALTTLTLFESRAAALRSAEEARTWVRANMADLYDEGPPEITAGEALVAVRA